MSNPNPSPKDRAQVGPRGYKGDKITVRLYQPEDRAIRARAESLGVPVAALARRIIEEYFGEDS